MVCYYVAWPASISGDETAYERLDTRPTVGKDKWTPFSHPECGTNFCYKVSGSRSPAIVCIARSFCGTKVGKPDHP